MYFPLKTGNLYKIEVKNLEEKTFNRNLKMLINILYNGSQIRDLAQKPGTAAGQCGWALTYKQVAPLKRAASALGY